MSDRSDGPLLQDIREAARRISVYTAEMNYADFRSDVKTQDAVIRNLEIIGEASKNLSKHLRSLYPDVQWSQMARLRDRLIHHYSGVNLDVVWEIVSSELPNLALWIEIILRDQTT